MIYNIYDIYETLITVIGLQTFYIEHLLNSPLEIHTKTYSLITSHVIAHIITYPHYAHDRTHGKTA